MSIHLLHEVYAFLRRGRAKLRSGFHDAHSTDRSIAARTASLLTETPNDVTHNVDRSIALRTTSLLTQVNIDEA